MMIKRRLDRPEITFNNIFLFIKRHSVFFFFKFHLRKLNSVASWDDSWMKRIDDALNYETIYSGDWKDFSFNHYLRSPELLGWD